MIYGYARISTKQQNIERQIRNIKSDYPQTKIIEEVFTGTKQDRPQLNKLLSVVKSNDTIVFDSVSRMSRNADDGFKLYESLYKQGVTLVFIKEPHINTDTYKKALQVNTIALQGTNIDYILEGVNKYLLSLAEEQIRLAFIQSEKEVTDLKQRVKEGIVTAKLEGKQIGQKKGNKLIIRKEPLIKEIILKYSKDFNGTLNDIDVMAVIKSNIEEHNKKQSDVKNKLQASISRNTYYKYKRELAQ